MECNHDFKIISKDILPSAYEQENNNQLKETALWESHDISYYRKKLIIVMRCTKCSKIKKIVETNP